MDIRRIIREEIRGLLSESINLNLSKQIRSKQLELDIDKSLEDIFGKNVYRLYYDVMTGKQVQPTRKEPKLKFDVAIVDNLRDDIELILNKLNYSLVDLDKNVAMNKDNGQTIKATKVLQSADKLVFKKYTEYLGSITNKADEAEKLYVVVSRHSHDIASMSTKPNISSCESLRDKTDIKQTMIDKDPETPIEGYGLKIWSAIQFDGIIFYLIREGDWNIQDPISRFLGAGICEFGNSYHFYGKFHNSFKNFVINWLEYYKSKILNQYTIKSDKDFFEKDTEELSKILHKSMYREADNNLSYVIRGLLKNNRYDVFYDVMTTDRRSVDDKGMPVYKKVFDQEQIPNLINVLKKFFGHKIINQFPDSVRAPMIKYITSEFERKTEKLRSYNMYLRSPEKMAQKLINTYSKHLDDKDVKERRDMLEIMESVFKIEQTVAFSELGEWIDADKYNDYKRELKFFEDNGGFNQLKQNVKAVFDKVKKHFGV